MSDRWRGWIALAKALLALLIVVGVVWFFVRILQSDELQATDPGRTPWQIVRDDVLAANVPALVLAGVLYLAGLGFSAALWVLLLAWAKEPLATGAAVRAYFLGHLGKYTPIGKGWSFLIRVGLAMQGGVRASTAAVTTIYETLTTMAAGALVAAVLLLFEFGGDRAWLGPALGLLALAGLPIVPGVFNFLVERVGARFRKPGEAWARFSTGALLAGIGLTACGWALLGGSLAATLWALDADWVADPVRVWLRCTAFIAVSYVAGFVASTPGGLGVRELVLQQLLAPTIGARAVVVVILLRLLWTVAELVAAGVVYWWPVNRRRP